jgi:hypothetical protein
LPSKFTDLKKGKLFEATRRYGTRRCSTLLNAARRWSTLLDAA